MEIIHEGAGPGRVYQDLGSLRGPTREIESLYVTITEPDEVFPLFQHGGVEFIYILEGCVEYGYGTKRYVLNAGDSMQFRGRGDTRAHCADRTPAPLLVAESHPPTRHPHRTQPLAIRPLRSQVLLGRLGLCAGDGALAE